MTGDGRPSWIAATLVVMAAALSAFGLSAISYGPTVRLVVSDAGGAILGSLLGAIVGGLIAYAVQRQALMEARAQRNEDRSTLRQSLAQSLIFKVTRIYSNDYSMWRHIEDAFEAAKRDGLDLEHPWRFVRPLANFPERVNLEAAEMGMLFGLDDTLFNRISELDIVHNGLVEAMRSLSAQREALIQNLPDEVGMPADEVSNKLRNLYPAMMAVNYLVDQLRGSSKKDATDAFEALDVLQRVYADKLGMKIKLVHKRPPPAFESADAR